MSPFDFPGEQKARVDLLLLKGKNVSEKNIWPENTYNNVLKYKMIKEGDRNYKEKCFL